MPNSQMSIDFEGVRQAVSISDEVAGDVCGLYLNSPSGFERSQGEASDTANVFNVLIRLLCEEHQKLNSDIRKSAQGLKDTDENERGKYRLPGGEAPGFGGQAQSPGGETPPNEKAPSVGGDGDRPLTPKKKEDWERKR